MELVNGNMSKMDLGSADSLTVETLLMAAGWSMYEWQAYSKEHSTKHKKLTEVERQWTVDEYIVDFELVVMALNLLAENQCQSVAHWQKQLVDFFINHRQSVTMEQQLQKRQAVCRKVRGRQQLPSDHVLLEQIRAQWKEIRDDLVDFDAFKVALDWILQPAMNSYTVDSLLEDAGRSESELADTAPGFQQDHVVELQLVVAALNRLWENTYSEVPDWQRTIVEFFDAKDNLQVLTVAKNDQKHMAVSRAIHCPTQRAEEKAWIAYVRTRWMALRDRLSGFVAFKLHMDAILMVTDRQ